jgi:hypothetical protein
VGKSIGANGRSLTAADDLGQLRGRRRRQFLMCVEAGGDGHRQLGSAAKPRVLRRRGDNLDLAWRQG